MPNIPTPTRGSGMPLLQSKPRGCWRNDHSGSTGAGEQARKALNQLFNNPNVVKNQGIVTRRPTSVNENLQQSLMPIRVIATRNRGPLWLRLVPQHIGPVTQGLSQLNHAQRITCTIIM